MVLSINPSNSHVLNSLAFNAGQLRKFYFDVTSLVSSSNAIFSSLRKKISNIKELNSITAFSNINSIKLKVNDINLNSNSTINSINSNRVRVYFSNILGDTEVLNYVVYRDSFTGITPIITTSTLYTPIVIKHHTAINTITSNSTLTYLLGRRYISTFNLESNSNLKAIMSNPLFSDVEEIKSFSYNQNLLLVRKPILVHINNNTNINYKIYRSLYRDSNITYNNNITYAFSKKKYIKSNIISDSNIELDQMGFLLYYNGRLKLVICHKSSPHHPEELEYKVRGIERKEKYPFNSFIIGSWIFNGGRWESSSYHFDTAETIKENTILDIHKIEEPVVVECDNKHSFFFTPTTKGSRISLTPVVGKELKYNGHKIFE